MHLREFIPPILMNFLLSSRSRDKIYSSFEEAKKVCSDGYEESDLATVVFEKTKRYKDELNSHNPFVTDMSVLKSLVGLSLAIKGSELCVVDFGGACGAHYFAAKAMLGNRVKLRWHVVETERMATKAQPLEDGHLKFFDSLDLATSQFDRVDMVFSSGALQYVPSPYETVETLINCGAENIFMTRMSLSTLRKELHIVQQSRLSSIGPGVMPADLGIRDRRVKYPVTFVRKDRLEEVLSSKYSLDLLIEEDRGAYMAGGNSINMYGYFGTLK